MPTLLQTAPMSESESSRPPLVFAYYVTGHGFGHATRVVEVRSLSCPGSKQHFRASKGISVLIDVIMDIGGSASDLVWT